MTKSVAKLIAELDSISLVAKKDSSDIESLSFGYSSSDPSLHLLVSRLNAKKFNILFDSLNGEVKDKYKIGQETLQKILVDFLINEKNANSPIPPRAINKFLTPLSDMPLLKITILKEVRGLNCGNLACIEMGAFKLHSWGRSKNNLTSKFPEIIPTESNADSAYFLEVTVDSRDFDYAEDEAKKLHNALTYVVSFLSCSREGSRGVFINRPHEHFMEHSYAYSNTGQYLRRSELKNYYHEINAEESRLSDPSAFEGRLISLIGKENTELEKSILKSAHWVGQALLDADTASAYVKIVTALEILLSTGSSARDNIAYHGAFIVGGSKDECLQSDRDLRLIYSKRSDIVHGSSLQISEIELSRAFWMHMKIIRSILTKEPYSGFTKKQELIDYITSMKYNSAHGSI